jgi:hypothetical protein
MADNDTISATRTHRPGAWPFNSPQPPHSRQEIEFADGARIWLRPVIEGGQPSAWLRDLGAPAEGVRIDLRALVPSLEIVDRTSISPRELAGSIATSLRERFKTRDEFIAAAVASGRPE